MNEKGAGRRTSEASMAALRPRYEAFKKQALGQLELCCQKPSAQDRVQLEKLKTLMHKLAGSAAIFGEPTVGEVASELDHALRLQRGRHDVKVVETALKQAASAFADLRS